ncbi:methyltransferase domain-containing protein [Seongchinamella sediminis]|uniref:Methyltransferase domain-containing protein n=1 Tax=Seongchinamella sediminis TaxID=2283635 RepID=A0A3L7E2X5_9GAMM|nr:50S ribosomal protein L11 methyltransferase [Seongchinamella sediminis]RLQ22763.1 methyltransferase domain-containing protein [Seongchinamella sediminis]
MSDPREALQSALAAIIPGGELATMTLPDVPEMQLLLLSPDYPRGNLSAAEMQRIMDNPLYWVFCWASGQVLARYLLDNPARVRGRRVLDFGCGSGVVAIAAALAGAREVIACDIDPLALAATGVNARLNGVELSLSDDYFAVSGELDIIIVADVLYDRENLPWLQRFAARAPQVLVADSRVKDFDYPPYRALSRRDSCTLPDLDESVEFRDVRIYLADSLGHSAIGGAP